jgi:hypothetical protein
MHKGITSENIIFAQPSAGNSIESFRDITGALVQGFGYSRKQTEAQTIDRGKILDDLEAALYRHPNYQGAAAGGYKIQYDIYSCGLLLFEIAIWNPLLSLLAATVRSPGTQSLRVELSPQMTHFHREEALELQRRILARVKEELPFRVGTMYCEAVFWCLNFYQTAENLPYKWQAGVEFYNHVVIPLDKICSMD